MVKMKNKNLNILKSLSVLFEFPQQNWKDKALVAIDEMTAHFPQTKNTISPFKEWVSQSSIIEIEENFTKTFHIQAVCYLDLGYVIFGEDYKRGVFLANMKAEQERYGIDLQNELADNIANVLKLMAVHQDDEFVQQLGSFILLPALKRMLKEFDDSRMNARMKVLMKKDKTIIMKNLNVSGIYKFLIESVKQCAESLFDNIEVSQVEETFNNAASNHFINGCSSCNTVSGNINTNLKNSQLC
jgi:nitrate reductase assembly molybdenum cofactor insertion protein NarJ